jgi:MarR family transcriptional regulator, lower aerobic nicotinate degradation pathway regulator
MISRVNSGTQAPAEPELVDGVVELSFAVQQVIGRVAAVHELSIVQARLLGILRDREPAMAALARFLNLDKSSVSGLVDRAERRGLVRRFHSEHDGRSVQVALTTAGRHLAETASRDIAGRVAALVDGLTDAERRHLTALTARVVSTSRDDALNPR